MKLELTDAHVNTVATALRLRAARILRQEDSALLARELEETVEALAAVESQECLHYAGASR